jgi:hypothetical protein
MPIASLLGSSVFEDRAVIVAAFEEVLSRLGIVQGSDPVREELIARRIIHVAKGGAIERRRLVRETLSAGTLA